MLLFVAGELLRSQKKNINDYTVTISHFTVRSPLFLSATETAKLQILVDSTTDFSNMPVEVYEWKSSDNWKKHATARLDCSVKADKVPNVNDYKISTTRNPETISKTNLESFYKSLFQVGLKFGDSFRSLKSVEQHDVVESVVEVCLPPFVTHPSSGGNFLCNPIAIDAMIQAYIFGKSPLIESLELPTTIEEFQWNCKMNKNSNIYVKFAVLESEEENIFLIESSGKVLATMKGIQTTKTTLAAVESALSLPINFKKNRNDQNNLMSMERWRPIKNKYSSSDEHKMLPEMSEKEKQTWLLFFSNIKEMDLAVTLKMTIFQKEVFFVRSCIELSKAFRTRKIHGVIFLHTEEVDEDNVWPIKYYVEFLQTVLSEGDATIGEIKLILVTKGAVFLGDQAKCYPSSAALWGMSRVFRTENSSFISINVDLDPEDTKENNSELLVSVLSKISKNYEDLMAIRKKEVFEVNLSGGDELTRNLLDLPKAINCKQYSLKLPTTKSIDDLIFQAVSGDEMLSENCVQVHVKATGLNFRDVFAVLKPSDEFKEINSLGSDISGIITSVGNKVSKWRVGDCVLGCSLNIGTLSSHITIDEESLVPLPQDWTFEEGSTVPVVFMTAYLSLIDTANLQKNETVLIHTGAGGVGLAAIQVAQNIGAKIIATAGSERKRKFLREVIGIKHVFHSRDLSYSEQIMEVTKGRGVDVVLNSLTSPGFKEASLSALRNGGRFIEMSKLNIWKSNEVKLLRDDVHYSVVDIVSVPIQIWNELIQKLWTNIHNKSIHPIRYDLFESLDIRAALRHLQRGKSTGKVIIRMNTDISTAAKLFNEKSTYLITGGLGGVGLEIAKWMAGEGAKYLILCGRSKPSHDAVETINNLEKNGITVLVVQSDVGNFDECQELMKMIKIRKVHGINIPPLRGIQHCAGYLSDRLIANQTWESFEKVFHGKMTGAWNLHTLSISLGFLLETFVLHSSVSALIGMQGQVNYAGANAFLDSLAHLRSSLCLPGISINWGLWDQIGMGAGTEIKGIHPISLSNSLSCFKEAILSGKTQVTICDFDVPNLRIAFPWIMKSYGAEYFSSISERESVTEQNNNSNYKKSSLWEELLSNPTNTEEILRNYIVTAVKNILKIEPNELIDVDASFPDLGLDSLMVTELKNMFQADIGVENFVVPVAIIAEAFYVKQLSKDISRLLTQTLKEYQPQRVLK